MSMKKFLAKKWTSVVAFTALCLPLFACLGGKAGVHTAQNLRVANYSSQAGLDVNFLDAGSGLTSLSNNLGVNESTCSQDYVILQANSPGRLWASIHGTANTAFDFSQSLSGDDGLQTILLYGPSTSIFAEVVNTMESAGGMDIFVCDLSQSDTSTYQVIVKDLTHGGSTQTSPVSGIDGQRHVVLPVSTAATYEVDLVSGSTVKASGTVSVDSTTHIHNIVSFTDNGSGGFNSHTLNGGDGCVSP